MSNRTRQRTQAGFTLIETAIAGVVLMIGILSLAAMLANSIALMSTSQNEYIAQQKAEEAVESIYTARNARQDTWANINNISLGGVFTDGATLLCDPGNDGILGTADDNCNVIDSIVTPGPDGILGTPDDVNIPLANFTRKITISAISGVTDVRQITVVVTYTQGGLQRSYTLTTNISQYS
ncbi:MAG TPA: hypothetical protein VN822_12825 [Candidatus Acidoferrales bacterium]|nr:hypothetical protein [Candidatus Acidoferrales bacterium]